MRISGENEIAADVAAVWAALLDPTVLGRTIPGCQRLVETGPHGYAMSVTAGVAAIKGSYDGTCELSDLVEHSSLVMRLRGAGAPGTIDATVRVEFEPRGESTLLRYDADAVVGGMIGGVGQRMLTGVSRRMAAEFFGNVERAITSPADRSASAAGSPDAGSPGSGSPGSGSPAGAVAAGWAAPPYGPARGAASLEPASFAKGVAVGAGLVLLGVLLGRSTR